MAEVKVRRMRQGLGRIETDKNVYELAIERINRAYDLMDSIAIAFSGGKDSTVCLNLALEVARERNKLPLIVYHYDEECIPYQTEEYVRRVSKEKGIELRWYCMPCKCTNACSKESPEWYPWAPEDKEKWARPLPPEAITELKGYDYSNPKFRMTFADLGGHMFPVEEYGNTGVIMGIRAEESMTRYRAVVRREKDNFIIYDNDIWEPDKRKKKGNIYKVYPIYDWKTADVWTAPKKFGWDYNRAYDVMDKAGLTPYQQRCAPPYGAEPLNNLWMFKVCFPELWEKMYNRVPGSSTAALYAKTQLYGFSGLPDKPSELSWEEAIKQEVKKFPAHQRELVAKKIRTYIKIHYKKVSDDITEEPHPETGIGWKYLYMIAIRGDFKSRRLPNAKSRGDILKEYRGESSGKNKSS